MSEDTVEDGDVVRVDGIVGPAMVVHYIDDDYASCIWFDDKMHHQSCQFLVKLLFIIEKAAAA